MNNEREYRAYIVGLDGHFVRAHGFGAENDDAAFEHARQYVDGHDVELWNGGRFVARLKKTAEKEQ